MKKFVYSLACITVVAAVVGACSSGHEPEEESVPPVSWSEIERADIPTFDETVERLGIQLTESQRQELETRKHLFGVIPHDQLPVRHRDGIVETRLELQQALQKASDEYQARLARGQRPRVDTFFLAMVKARSIDLDDPIHRMKAYQLVTSTGGSLDGYDGVGSQDFALSGADGGGTCQQTCTGSISFARENGSSPGGNGTSVSVECTGDDNETAKSLTTTGTITCTDSGTVSCNGWGYVVQANFPISAASTTNISLSCSTTANGASGSSWISTQVSSNEACGQSVNGAAQSQSVELRIGASASGTSQSTSQTQAHYTNSGNATFNGNTKKFDLGAGSSTQLDLQVGTTNSQTWNYNPAVPSLSHSVGITGNMLYAWYVPVNGQASRTVVTQTSGCSSSRTSWWNCDDSVNTTLTGSTTGFTGVNLATCPPPPDAGTPDSGTPDAGKPDSGTPDAGTPDAGTPDSGTPDAGTPAPDAGTPAPDAGTPRPPDAG